MKAFYYTVSKTAILVNGVEAGCCLSIRDGWGKQQDDQQLPAVQMGKASLSRPNLIQKGVWYPVCQPDGKMGKIRFSGDSYVWKPIPAKQSAVVCGTEGA